MRSRRAGWRAGARLFRYGRRRPGLIRYGHDRGRLARPDGNVHPANTASRATTAQRVGFVGCTIRSHLPGANAVTSAFFARLVRLPFSLQGSVSSGRIVSVESEWREFSVLPPGAARAAKFTQFRAVIGVGRANAVLKGGDSRSQATSGRPHPRPLSRERARGVGAALTPRTPCQRPLDPPQNRSSAENRQRSNSPSPTDLPVTATRTGWMIWPILICFVRHELRASSLRAPERRTARPRPAGRGTSANNCLAIALAKMLFEGLLVISQPHRRLGRNRRTPGCRRPP